MTLTDKETAVYNAALEICMNDYCADIDDLINATGYPLETVRGVLGTLTQKNRIHTEDDIRDGRKFQDIFACNDDGDAISFGEV